MSHIIVSPGGRCQAVTWKKKKCLCECERVCGFISFIFHGPFLFSQRTAAESRKGRLLKGDFAQRVLFTLQSG